MARAFTARSAASIYEDAPLNYLIDYAFVNGVTAGSSHTLNSSAWTPTAKRFSIINIQPWAVTLHTTPFRFIWKIRSFRQWGLKRSTSLPGGSLAAGDNVLIGGFIVSGTEPKSWCFARWGHRSAASGFPMC